MMENTGKYFTHGHVILIVTFDKYWIVQACYSRWLGIYTWHFYGNQGYKPVTEQPDFLNIGRRLDFSSLALTYQKTQSFTASSGFTVTSSAAIYNYGYVWPCQQAPNSASTYLLQYLFDQTLHTDPDHFFLAATGTATLHLNLKRDYLVNTIKIYPNQVFPTKFKVWNILFLFYVLLHISFIFSEAVWSHVHTFLFEHTCKLSCVCMCACGRLFVYTHLQVYVTGTVLCMLKRKNCDHLFRFTSFRKVFSLLSSRSVQAHQKETVLMSPVILWYLRTPLSKGHTCNCLCSVTWLSWPLN